MRGETVGRQTGTFEVGKFYRVPTVRGLWRGMDADWVVLGPLHEDKEVIGFDEQHYHLHPQFNSDVILNAFRGVPDVFSMPLTEVKGVKGYGVPDVPLGPVVYRRRKCMREMPAYPRYAPPWLSKLESWMATKGKPRIDVKHPICPHRGADLSKVPVVDGCVTCPLHGLKWNASTGELVRVRSREYASR